MPDNQRQNIFIRGTRNFGSQVSRLIRSPFNVLRSQHHSVSREGEDVQSESVGTTEEDSASNILQTHDKSESEVDAEIADDNE